MKRIFYIFNFLLVSVCILNAQSVQIDSINTTDPNCPEGTDGTITIFASGAGIISYSLDSINFQQDNNFVVPAGTYTVFAGDSINTVSQVVSVGEGIDTIAPTITCPSGFSLPLNDECRITVPELRDMAVASDNCTPTDSLMIFQSPYPPQTVKTGVMEVMFKLFAMDQAGNFSSCEIMVIPTDSIAPELDCPESLTIALDENCGITVLDLSDSIAIVDNCTMDGMITFSQLPAIGEMFDTTTTTVTLTATDESGNASSCDIILNGTDQTAPELTCPSDFEIFLDGDCRIEVPELRDMVKVTDNCTSIDSIMLFQSPTPPATIGTGVRTVIFEIFAMDGDRNFTSCEIMVTAVDTIAPIVECPEEVVVGLDENCEASLPDFNDFIIITDNCSTTDNANLTQSIAAGTPADAGSVSISLLVADESGNTSGCTVLFTVVDNTMPIAVCKDATLKLGANGTAIVDPKALDGGSGDNCSAVSLSVDNKTFDCDDLGPNTVTLRVRDENGNKTECRSTLTVVDEIPAAVECRNITVALDENSGTVEVSANAVRRGVTDNCGIYSVELNKTQFDCDDLGRNKARLIVMDNSWNKSTCEVEITVVEPDDLPNPFSSVSIGQSRGDATYQVCDDKFTLESVKVNVGATFNNPQDFNEFTYININGDFSFTASVAERDSRMVAGLMVRAGTSDNAPFAYAGVNTDRGTSIETGARSAAGGNISTGERRYNGSTFTITRSGNLITIRNGSSTVLQQNIDLGSSAVVGFFVTSRWRNSVSARFSNVNYAQFFVGRPEINTNNLNSKLAVSAYPNPASDIVTVEVGSLLDQETTLRLINISGQEVLVQQYNRLDQSRIQLNVADIEQGLYFLSIESAETKEQIKIIIE